MARQAQRKLAALTVDEDASPARGRWIHKQVSQGDCEAWLSPIERVTGADAKARKGLLPLSLDTYLSLLDWTGRCLHEGKSGAIPADLAPVLDRLEVERAVWLETVERLGGGFITRWAKPNRWRTPLGAWVGAGFRGWVAAPRPSNRPRDDVEFCALVSQLIDSP